MIRSAAYFAKGQLCANERHVFLYTISTVNFVHAKS
jgi:hypothetical protein